MSKISKAISEAKKQIDPHVKITKTLGNTVYFKVDTYKGMYNDNMKQAPKWFQAFEKKNDERWARQEAFNNEQRQFNSIMLKRTTVNMINTMKQTDFVIKS